MELLIMRGAINRTASARGFTLIEMVMVMVVVGAIFAIGAQTLGRAFESYVLTSQTTDVDWQGRVALERIVRDLREIRTATATDLDVSSGTQIRFIDADGNGVCFYRNGASQLMRSADGPSSACGTTNPQPLADNVATSGLNFYYVDNAGAVTATATQVYYITVTLNVVDGQINETFRVSVQPRRF